MIWLENHSFQANLRNKQPEISLKTVTFELNHFLLLKFYLRMRITNHTLIIFLAVVWFNLQHHYQGKVNWQIRSQVPKIIKCLCLRCQNNTKMPKVQNMKNNADVIHYSAIIHLGIFMRDICFEPRQCYRRDPVPRPTQCLYRHS